MSSFDHEQLAQALLPAVLEAGAIEMRHYEEGVTVETKADASPVTAADREAEAVLLAALARAAPGIPVIAEEAVSQGTIPAVAASFFLVDPLDGTREFINRRGEFTVNVALVEQGRPIFGIVYAPALSELYATLGAARAVFARVPPGDVGKDLATYGCADVHTRIPNPAALTAVASRSHLTPETDQFLARYRIANRRSAGSSLKFCLLARGEADIYPRHGTTMEWDTAAGHAVLVAAGGCLTTPDGAPFIYGKAAEGFRNPHFVAWGTRKPIAAAM
ncbi:MAG: 3'(2'),5'-bisphosphate nucleotidase CysQ [Hyphomicrobiaceae bacterium]|jgi:3'(2'), 5'-bisphosphate nucleotidase